MLHFKLILTAALGLALPVAAWAEPALLPGFAHPESVLPVGEAVFVSNLGAKLDPMGKDGDGFISRLGPDGATVALKAMTGLHAPKGMALLDGRLFVTDIDRVLGFDPASGAQVFEASMHCATPCFFNDLAEAEGRLLMTDTAQGKLWAVDVQSGAFALLAEGMDGANGVIWDAAQRRAVVVELGADFAGGDIYTWSEAAGLSKIPASPHGVFDGLALLPDGRALVSDWVGLKGEAGAVLAVDLATGATEALPLPQALHGPADFALTDDKLWLPAMLDGAVAVLPAP
ncbi:MAG: hypothetical protein JNN06_14785 [Gemmobacter sp.]|uniref:SMP-30/gluconolactonase/LRE family protein n=1 Tax=Gemmobacter sp. TaxID=1898957 RepID=UPI001A4AB89B|nr:hypothetical protein [Gemmobacter sp.]MBL8563535.1 hypothetical protein [Gemmobacter sp.]